jgi:hypothetical protein
MTSHNSLGLYNKVGACNKYDGQPLRRPSKPLNCAFAAAKRADNQGARLNVHHVRKCIFQQEKLAKIVVMRVGALKMCSNELHPKNKVHFQLRLHLVKRQLSEASIKNTALIAKHPSQTPRARLKLNRNLQFKRIPNIVQLTHL